MGILNVTPDSFSDGGRFFSPDSAVAQGEAMAAAGADILDVGGESTRPFSDRVTAEEEKRRVLPVIRDLAKRLTIPISIDTTKYEVACEALNAGASIINDIRAFRLDPDLAALTARRGVPVVMMHMKGTPETMQVDPTYEDLLGEIRAFFEERIRFAEAAGISRTRIIIDPGIGFGKTAQHNFLLLRRLKDLAELNLPILVGPSRKAFIRKTISDTELSPQAPAVETGTQAAVAAAILNGAHIVRVHDVAATRITAKIVDAVQNAR